MFALIDASGPHDYSKFATASRSAKAIKEMLFRERKKYEKETDSNAAATPVKGPKTPKKNKAAADGNTDCDDGSPSKSKRKRISPKKKADEEEGNDVDDTMGKVKDEDQDEAGDMTKMKTVI